MPETPQTPTTTGFNYGISLVNSGGKGGEFGKHVSSLRLTNSINSIWTNIHMNLNIDIDEIVQNQIFGQDEFILNISHAGEEGQEKDDIEIPLMYLQNTNSLIPKNLSQGSDQQQDMQPMQFQFLPMRSVEVAINHVNYVFVFGLEKQSTVTPINFLEELIKAFKTVKYEINKDGMNENVIDQIIIPPMTLRQAIDYINQYFPYYKGQLFFYIDHTGKIKMWDLSQRIKKNPKIKIHHIAIGNKDKDSYEKIAKSVEDGTNFVCTRPIETVHHYNSNILTSGYSNVLITRPNNDLYSLLAGNVDISEPKFAIKDVDESDNFFTKNLKKLMRFNSSNSSNGYDGSLLSSQIANSMRKAITVSIPLARNVKISSLLSCTGDVAELECQTEEYSQYSGKYIVDSVDITLDNSDGQNYACSANLLLSRTNFNSSSLKRDII